MNLTQALGWTLIHFLWQGALIAALLAAVLAALKGAGPRARYGVSLIAMLLMFGCAVLTFAELMFASSRPHGPAPVPLGRSLLSRSGLAAPMRSVPADYMNVLVWVWIGGVLALSARSAGGWAVARRLAARQICQASSLWNQRLEALAKRLSISAPVSLAVSALAQVPTVIGWAKPVVLLPASIFMNLSQDQIEALLAHELAHVRRHDYPINLLQTAAETLLFYHPAVWWVNRVIRQEREHCCDDLTVEICGNPLGYARALTEIEQMRQPARRFAMAADGGGPLLSRIQRLLNGNQTLKTTPSGWMTLMLAACILAAGVTTNMLAQRPETTPSAGARAESDRDSTGWLDGIEAAGYRGLDVDTLIRLKEHGIDGDYIRQIRAAGLDANPDAMVRLEENGITGDFIDELKETGLRILGADEVIRIAEHGITPNSIRELENAGLAQRNPDEIIRLSEHGVTAEFIRQAERHGLRKLTPDQLVRLAESGILAPVGL